MAESENYWNALDKRTGVNQEKLDVNPNRVGISHGIGDVGEGLKANVFRGATAVELGFMGRGKGYRSQPTGATPESFGAKEREDIRQLARINEVELSTHAAPDLGRVSGITDDNSSFSPAMRENALHEIQRAISFAADTAQGGPVVVHLGEFPRAIFDVDDQFEAHPEERERAPVHLVDKRTGQIQMLRRDMEVSVPKVKRDDNGKPILDANGNDIFVRDEETRAIEFEKKKFSEFKEEADKVNMDAGEYFMREYFKKQIEQYEGEQIRWTHQAEQSENRYKALAEVKRDFDKALAVAEDKGAVRGMLREMLDKRGLLPEGLKQLEGISDREVFQEKKFEQLLNEPEVFLESLIQKEKREFDFANNIAMSTGRSKHETEQNVENLKPIHQYGVEKSAETLARAAMTAYQTEKARGFDKPLFVSPENWNPESYGNHPKEYKKLIIESRKEMQRMLEKDGYEKKEAKKIAADHVQGTFDVGHLNFWRKYFKPSDPSKGPDAADKEFRKWVDKQVKELTKEKIIGNVHLSDNFGYHDEHLAPGEGNAPIEKFVKRLEEKGYTGKYIGEPGGQKEGFIHTAWTGTLNTLNSPIYRTDSQTQTWSDMEQSYFGHVPQSPNFLVGDIVPSKDWALWSETPLE